MSCSYNLSAYILYIYIFIYVYNLYAFILSSIDDYMGGFHLLIVMHSAAMNTGVQVAVSAFNSLVYTPRSEVARSMVIVPLIL